MPDEELLDQMLRDLLDSVEHFYGPDGLGKVVEQMKLMNRAREHSREIDALEEAISRARA